MSDWAKEVAVGVSHIKKVDPILAQVIEGAPLPTFTPHKNYYQELVESIIGQQLSVKAAATILKRFKELFTNSFPTPEEILSENVDNFRAVGLSRQKASYIRDLAEKVINSTVQFNQLDALSNQEVIDELTKVKGVGVWTVHMFLISCMGRLDVLPTGDLGIRNGVQKLYGLNARPEDKEIIDIASENNWSPYETIASWYIWRSLNNKPESKA